MPTRLCLNAGCPHPATYRGRCVHHARTINRATHRNRGIYNSAKWRHTREVVLSEQPLCECGAIATDVHHIVDLEQGGNPWARNNLQALCHSCHSVLTRRGQES
jgi:5-methylcytosine-specific restriction protein A